MLIPLAGNSIAATQGQVGATSQGELAISLIVGEQVRISGLSDIHLATAAGSATHGRSGACIYASNNSSYQINALGSGTANAFTLGSEDASYSASSDLSVSYTVALDNGASARELLAGIPLGGNRFRNPSSTDCATAGPNAHIEVSIPTEERAHLTSGNYTGTLTLVIAPE